MDKKDKDTFRGAYSRLLRLRVSYLTHYTALGLASGLVTCVALATRTDASLTTCGGGILLEGSQGDILEIYSLRFAYYGAIHLCHSLDTSLSWVLGWSLCCGGPAHQIAGVQIISAGVDQKSGPI